MNQELNGKISEIFDEESGIIVGEDKHEYYFSKCDFLENFKIEINKKVKFKPEKYLTEKKIIYKAVLISNEE